jgi:hypothetical protein
MDQLSYKYTAESFANGGPDRVGFVTAIKNAAQRTLGFTDNPA